MGTFWRPTLKLRILSENVDLHDSAVRVPPGGMCPIPALVSGPRTVSSTYFRTPIDGKKAHNLRLPGPLEAIMTILSDIGFQCRTSVYK